MKKRAFFCVYYTFFVNGMMALVMGAVMPFLMADYKIDYDTAGIFLSAHSIGNLVAGFAVLFLLGRVGRKKTIIALSSLLFLSYLGIVLSSHIFVLLPAFLLTGIGRGSISNVNNAIVNDMSAGKSVYLNLLHMFFAVGAFVSPLMASILLNMGHDWKTVVLVGVVFSLSILIVYSLLLPKTGEPPVAAGNPQVATEKTPPPDQNKPKFYKNIDFYLAAGVMFFYLGTETAVNGWVVTYLVDSGRMDSGLAQLILSLLWAVIIVGRLTTAFLSLKFNSKTLILICSFCAAVMFIVFITSVNQALTAAAIILFGFFFAGIYPTTIGATGKILKGSGAAMGTLLAIASTGGIITPMAVGFVATVFDITVGLGFVSMTAVLTVICAVFLKIRDLKSKDN
ncbi:MAG: MFS transporter [Oscillospiraceae bacterium]|nr:MFS transporter [Oscillospiraceae bacterium]